MCDLAWLILDKIQWNYIYLFLSSGGKQLQLLFKNRTLFWNPPQKQQKGQRWRHTIYKTSSFAD